MSPQFDPATMSRSELVREAHQLGMHQLEHLHIEELVEAVMESRQGVGAGAIPEPITPGRRA